MDNKRKNEGFFIKFIPKLIPKVISIGFLLLILYVIIAASIYMISQMEISFYVKKSSDIALYTTKLSTNLNNLIKQSSFIIKYTKLNDQKKLKATLDAAKSLIIATNGDFKNVKQYIKDTRIGSKTILPYINKSYFNYINFIRPIMLRLIKYHKSIAKKIFFTPIELALYKESPIFSPFAIKAIKMTINREKILRSYFDIIYLIGSLIIFSSILFFIIYSNKKNKEIKRLYARFNLIFDNIYDLAYVTEFTADAVPKHFIEVNNMALKKLGYSKDEFLKLSHLDIINANKQDILNMMQLLFKKESMTYPAEIKTKNGKIIPFEVTSRIYKIKDESPIGVCIARDVTERIKMEEKLKKLSVEDSLTGAYNRNKYKEIIGKEIKKAKRYEYPFSVIMFDIDFFKEINDRYGHIIGDDVLKALALLIMKNIREEDYFIRWGGEEFLIITPHTSSENALRLAEKLRLQAESHNFVKNIKITLSFGIAMLRKKDNDASFIKRADDALYKAKLNGRNRCVILD
jgi:diguanylate cyclase (GGDEF)-like protein/PAS domain S-box-containing protein